MCVQCSFRNPDCFADTCGSYFHSGSLLSTVTNRLLTGLKLFRVLAVPQIQSNKHKNGFPFLSQSSMLESYHVLPCLTMSYHVLPCLTMSYPHFQRDTAPEGPVSPSSFPLHTSSDQLSGDRLGWPWEILGISMICKCTVKTCHFCGWFFHRGSSNMSIPIIEIPGFDDRMTINLYCRPGPWHVKIRCPVMSVSTCCKGGCLPVYTVLPFRTSELQSYLELFNVIYDWWYPVPSCSDPNSSLCFLGPKSPNFVAQFLLGVQMN